MELAQKWTGFRILIDSVSRLGLGEPVSYQSYVNGDVELESRLCLLNMSYALHFHGFWFSASDARVAGYEHYFNNISLSQVVFRTSDLVEDPCTNGFPSVPTSLSNPFLTVIGVEG